jgi:hypothetical protein
MPITPDGKVIFIHIPKCAGTSVNEKLGVTRALNERDEQCMHGIYDSERSASYQHFTARQLRDHIGEEKWAAAQLRFSIVRNPWDRIASEWSWRKQNHFPTAGANTFSEFVRAVAAGERPSPADHYGSQISFLTDPCDEARELMVDVVCRFETLASDWEQHVAPRIWPHTPAGDPSLALPMHNVSRSSRDYRTDYDCETSEIVAQLYAEDISRFGYKF